MQTLFDRGLRVRGELNTANATAGVAVSWYDVDGNAVTIGSGERLAILHVFIKSAGTALGRVALVNDADDAGKRIRCSTFTSWEGLSLPCFEPIYLRKGVGLKIFAANSGQIDAQIEAIVLKA
jgi:hypothetical protein